MLRQLIGINHLKRLIEFFQPASVGIEHGDPTILHRSLIFTAGFHLAVDAELVNQIAKYRLTRQIEFQTGSRKCNVADVIVGADVMGQINGKSGIATRRPQANFLRLDKYHFVVWEIQRKLPGARESCETGTDDHPPGRTVPAVSRLGTAWLAQMKPATTIIIGG
jgi:hypothetical protein